jgi:hypothetical protein
MDSRQSALFAGLGQGLNIGMQNMVKIKMMKHKQDQEDQVFDIDFKKKKLDLQQAELTGQYSKDTLDAQNSILQEQKKMAKATSRLKTLALRKAEQDAQEQVKVHATGMKWLDALTAGGKNADNLRGSIDFGGATLQRGNYGARTKSSTSDLLDSILNDGEAGSGTAADSSDEVSSVIEQLRSQGKQDDEIKKMMEDAGYDTNQYGL